MSVPKGIVVSLPVCTHGRESCSLVCVRLYARAEQTRPHSVSHSALCRSKNAACISMTWVAWNQEEAHMQIEFSRKAPSPLPFISLYIWTCLFFFFFYVHAAHTHTHTHLYIRRHSRIQKSFMCTYTHCTKAGCQRRATQSHVVTGRQLKSGVGAQGPHFVFKNGHMGGSHLAMRKK